jgi:hypothetical protein
MGEGWFYGNGIMNKGEKNLHAQTKWFGIKLCHDSTLEVSASIIK